MWVAVVLTLFLAAAAAAQPELTPTPAGQTAVPVAPASAHTFQAWFRLAVLVAAPLCIAGLWAGNVIRPGSFGKRIPSATGDHPAGMLLIAGFAVFFSQAIGQMIVVSNLLPWPRFISQHTLEGSAALAIGTAAVGVPTALTIAAMATRGWRSLFRPSDLAVGVAALLLTYPIVACAAELGLFLVQMLSDTKPNAIAHETLSQIADDPTNPWVIALTLRAVIAAPIIEEVMYRLFLQGALIKLTGSAWIGIIATSALFAASHLSGGTVPWHAIPALFVLSIGFGVVHVRTGRIGPPIVAHMAFNALNVAITLAR